jgi:hypothetical protein
MLSISAFSAAISARIDSISRTGSADADASRRTTGVKCTCMCMAHERVCASTARVAEGIGAFLIFDAKLSVARVSCTTASAGASVASMTTCIGASAHIAGPVPLPLWEAVARSRCTPPAHRSPRTIHNGNRTAQDHNERILGAARCYS